MGFTHEAVIFLVAAVIGVALFKRIGLGAVPGYLVAGLVIGPYGLKLIGDEAEAELVMSVSELGVVLLLFIIGLELQPRRLWTMRGVVFGVGSVQMSVTTAVFFAVLWLAGLPPGAAFVLGFAFSLSSTALAVQALGERGQLNAPHGRIAFGILLFQDVAAIPFLALVPLLAGEVQGASWYSVLKVAATLGGMVVASRLLLRPVLSAVARLKVPELFTSSALLVVVGTAVLMETIGLSATLGAFLAGVLLADSEYRHELEADLAPFKGLLLGLFFMAVGMSINLRLAVDRPWLVLGLVLGLVALKGLVLFCIGLWRVKDKLSALRLAIAASQGGEFAFVVVKLATQSHVTWTELEQLVVFVVGASLATTPVLFALSERFLAPRLTKKNTRAFDEPGEHDAPVLIAGLGRVGQVVARVLAARKIGFVSLDANAEHVDFMRQFGHRVFFGDAKRLELLEAAGASKARIFVLAIDNVEDSLACAHLVKKHFPNLRIIARARNRHHAYAFKGEGIDSFVRETFDGSVALTGQVLKELGMEESEVTRTLQVFRTHDEQLLEETWEMRGDTQALRQRAADARAEFEKLFEADAAALSNEQ